jgi:DNA invertase Pin-like site-specific DNA recombinase
VWNIAASPSSYLDSTGLFKEAVIGILAAVAKQERVRLSEPTMAGLDRARAQGRVGGRPKAADNPGIVSAFRKLKASGLSVRQIACKMGNLSNHGPETHPKHRMMEFCRPS